MRIAVSSWLLGFTLSCTAHAQIACRVSALPDAARSVTAVRHQMHGEAVGEFDPAVPAPIVSQLAQLKNALAQAAEAVMACAGPAATPDSLQKVLADALHANLSIESETGPVTKAGKEIGAYGSDLAVQVLPLSSSPRYMEIDLRFGVECGDDNLLLVYKQVEEKQAGPAWQAVLRWEAPGYRNVDGAFGDFILLTPLPGTSAKPNWRVVVVHGRPGCAAGDSHSHFDLDLLQPGADPAHPQVIWHLERPYQRNDTPRLATTEDTLTFELIPPAPATGLKRPGAPTATLAHPAQIYRYRISSDNQVQPVSTATGSSGPSLTTSK